MVIFFIQIINTKENWIVEQQSYTTHTHVHYMNIYVNRKVPLCSPLLNTNYFAIQKSHTNEDFYVCLTSETLKENERNICSIGLHNNLLIC